MLTDLQIQCTHLAQEYIHGDAEIAGSILEIGMCPDCGLIYFERWHRLNQQPGDIDPEYSYLEVNPVWHERILKIATTNLLSNIEEIKRLQSGKTAALGQALRAENRLDLMKGVLERKLHTLRNSAAEVVRKMALPGSHRERDAQALSAIYEQTTILMSIERLENQIIGIWSGDTVDIGVDDIPF